MTIPVNVKVVKRNGQQIVRIHWFVNDPNGPICNTGIGQAESDVLSKSKMVNRIGGGVGYIACQPKLKTLRTPIINGMYVPVCCTPEAKNATCPECMKTVEFQKTIDSMKIQLLEPEENKKTVELPKKEVGVVKVR